MTELNHNLRGLALGGIRRFTTLAQERGDCILLTLGEPEFDTPGPIRQACKDALDRGRTHYTENRGDLALRQAISRFERQSRGLDYAPEEILITLGATEAIYTALTGVLNPGDEVIIPTPAFSLYDTVTRMAGAVPAPVDTTENGFQLTAAALEAALPVLRTQLAESGIQLGQSNISGESFSGQQQAASQQQQSQRTANHEPLAGEDDDTLPVPVSLQVRVTGNSGVDIFA